MLSKAFVFPGQGSQSVGMLNELSLNYPFIVDLFAEVSEQVGYDVWSLVQHGPEVKLNQTEHTQVAMLTADVAVFQVIQHERSIKADMMAGHSLGEYAALVCAGAISLAEAASLVSLRGKYMQDTVPMGEGAMAAIIGLSDAQVQALCREASSDSQQVTPANYNAVGQVVIAGHTPAVEKALVLADDLGARMVKMIPVSVPCHCPLLEKASDKFADALRQVEFKVPGTPVISNVDLSVHKSPEQIKKRLKEQLYCPVRWVETIQLMKEKGVGVVIECGPGKVLSGLAKRIDRTLKAVSVHDQASLTSALKILETE